MPSGLLKYDDAEGSAEERTLGGSGVVFRLRGGAEGFDPGFALPLLLVEGAMLDARTFWNVGVCGERDAGWRPVALGMRDDGV